MTLELASALVSTGLASLGYIHLGIDGGWYNFDKDGLNASGYPTAPAGWDFPQLTSTLRSQGLLLDMYVTGGMKTVYKHEAAWAAVMFGEWGASGVKVDHMCTVPECIIPGQAPGHQMAPAYQQATILRWVAGIAAVNATGRVLFQNCGVGCMPAAGNDTSGSPAPWADWCPATANLWRSSGDIAPVWGAIVGTNLASLAGRGGLAGPGGWNYADSLEIGNSRRGVQLTPGQARAHFSLWCVTSQPLFLGMDIRNITQDDLSVVSNPHAIAVDQAWAGFAGDMLNFSHYPPADPQKNNYTVLPQGSVWWKPLPNGTAAAVLFNRGGGALNISFRFQELVWGAIPRLANDSSSCSVFSVWDDRELGVFQGGFGGTVEGESCLFLLLRSCS